MERFTLQDAARWTGGTITGNAELTNISTDSRQTDPQTLFVPICGERYDGHDFIEKAIAGGAAAVVSHRAQERYPVPALLVKNTSQALLDLAGEYRQMCGGCVVGVTGSVGKTTTKELIYSVVKQRFTALKTQGNLNNEIGLPLTLFRMQRDTEVMVAEMGMNHFGEISRMTAAARPNIAVITNIGTSHIEYLGSREGICKAKLEILEGLAADGCAVFCGDEPLLWQARQDVKHKVFTYGIENAGCDLTARLQQDGTFEIVNNALPCKGLAQGQSFLVRLRLPGAHNVLNALAAAAVGLLLGQSADEIAAGLADYQTSGLRQNIYEQAGFTIYADCYNASPDAMEAALGVLKDLGQGGKRIAVLGSMLELGDYAEEGHLRAGRAAAKNADALFAYGPDAETMVKGAVQQGLPQAFSFSDHAALAAALQDTARQGDALLFKGSRGMKMEEALALFLGEDVKE